MEKERLVENVKTWIDLDNEIKLLQKEIKQRRQKKKELTNDLVSVMKNNEIDCFDTKSCKLIYTKLKFSQDIEFQKSILLKGNPFFRDYERSQEQLHML